MTVGSLFAGIGGFDLGFTRAGFDVRWQVEIDPWCRAVLAQHWPDVRRYADVRRVVGRSPVALLTEADILAGLADAAQHGRRPGRPGRSAGDGARLSDEAQRYECDGILDPVDVICGGFPCQPHSLAGRRAGADDDRDLWPEFVRLIRELEPRWVVAENVPGLLSSDAGRFFGTVLGDLAACGYDAEWHVLSAAQFGAPHRRDRVWLVAYPARRGWPGRGTGDEGGDVTAEWTHGRAEPARSGAVGRAAVMADADAERWDGRPRIFGTGRGREFADSRQWESEPDVDVADADESRSQRRIGAGVCERPDERTARARGPRIFTDADGQWREWEPESGFCRVAHGVPHRVDRLRGLGNAIVPPIAEWIARRIRAAEGLT